MGNMGDIFRDGKEIVQERRRSRSTQAGSMVEDVRKTVDVLNVDPSGSWNIVKGSHKIQFYPTKGTWQYKNRMYRGGVFSFIDWLDTL